MKRNRDEQAREVNREETKVRTGQLLTTGLKEDEVQELAEYREDGWEFVDDDY
ncbi:MULTISPECIES: hypothetical protein [Jeotgalibacillus]|uniref:hypothetical protein n=1 Tax=Jeotgalibacillus TaxID=157226 RepID=UPI00141BA4E5|nr:MULTISPECIES: hypothetical protein [Jeotgalibacillus]